MNNQLRAVAVLGFLFCLPMGMPIEAKHGHTHRGVLHAAVNQEKQEKNALAERNKKLHGENRHLKRELNKPATLSGALAASGIAAASAGVLFAGVVQMNKALVAQGLVTGGVMGVAVPVAVGLVGLVYLRPKREAAVKKLVGGRYTELTDIISTGAFLAACKIVGAPIIKK
ncbi:MAG TPA: hypothetical protein VGT41_03510 [Candidatus Babeliales bacterium]|nr:hypothetical protein [Candidatus Babeliales bacterium]